jgi:hypothetical protein
VTRLEEIPEALVSDAESTSGNYFAAHHRSRLRVRISLERFTSDALYRQLMALQSHLQRGGSVGFARDSSKAFAGYVRPNRPISSGETSIYTEGNVWNYQSGTYTLSSGDELWLASDAAEGLWEMPTVSAHAGGLITTAAGMVRTYTSELVFVRWRDFHPALRLQAGERPVIVSTDRRIAHTFDVELVEDWTWIRAMAPFGADALPGRVGTTAENGTAPFGGI